MCVAFYLYMPTLGNFWNAIRTLNMTICLEFEIEYICIYIYLFDDVKSYIISKKLLKVNFCKDCMSPRFFLKTINNMFPISWATLLKCVWIDKSELNIEKFAVVSLGFDLICYF